MNRIDIYRQAIKRTFADLYSVARHEIDVSWNKDGDNITLRRLEDEQREFKEFLKRLRVAKDRAEFDQFMNDRHLDAPSASRRTI